MGVKYVKEFMYPSEGGFHKGDQPARARPSYKGVPPRAMPDAPAKGAPKMESRPKMGKGQGYAVGGKVASPLSIARDREVIYPVRETGGEKPVPNYPVIYPTRETGGEKPAPVREVIYPMRPEPTAKEKAAMASAKYAKTIEGMRRSGILKDGQNRTRMPKIIGETPPLMKKAKGGMAKVGKVMREYKEGKLHSGSKKGPKVKSREQAVAIALSEARRAGAKIPKKAEGGIFSNEYMAYQSKGPKTRGTYRKGREQSRRERMERLAQEKMEHAEKYAPGLSLDMPDKKAHGGMPTRRKAMYGGGKC